MHNLNQKPDNIEPQSPPKNAMIHSHDCKDHSPPDTFSSSSGSKSHGSSGDCFDKRLKKAVNKERSRKRSGITNLKLHFALKKSNDIVKLNKEIIKK